MPSYVKRTGRPNAGHKKQIRPGKWEVTVTHGTKANGARRQVHRIVNGTEEDADAMIDEIFRQLEVAPCLNTGYTLGDYFEKKFIPNRSDLSKQTLDTHKAMWKHVPQEWKDADLVERDHEEVQRWILSLTPGVATTAMKTFRAVNNAAWYEGYFTEKPYKAPFRYPRARGRGAKKRVTIWNARMVAQAMVILEHEDFYGLFLCAVGAGLRRGEALAMDWDNIEFEPEEYDDRGNVIHWWARLTIDGSVSATEGEKDTKTDESYRICPLAPVFADRLHRLARESGPVALSREGGRMSLSTVRRRWEGNFKEGGLLAGLPYIPLGRLRHTNSNIMRQAGVEDSAIADYHGHVDPKSVDQRHYLMPTSDVLDDAADMFGEAIQLALDMVGSDGENSWGRVTRRHAR